MKNYPRKDWTGQKYNSLTFIRTTDKRSGAAMLWELKCDCGKLVYKRAHIVAAGSIQSCGCKQNEARSRSGMKARKYDPKVSSALRVWRDTYQDGCDFDTFLTLSQQHCHYCGRLPHRTMNAATSSHHASSVQLRGGNFTYNGLDRVDSTKDHAPDNIVPCCSTCNRMKGTLTSGEFLSHITMVSEFQDRSSPSCSVSA